MESIHQDYDHLVEQTSDSPPSSPDINDIVGAPQMNPQVGLEHQVDVPSFLKEYEQLQLQMNPADSEAVHDNSLHFAIGLTIPTMWVPKEVDNGFEGLRLWHSRDNDLKKKNSIPDHGIESKPTTSVNKGGQLDESQNYMMVPGTLSNSWSDSDVKSFVLSLFIFGKNFIQIQKFLENKGMGDILSFYYGKFYKSEEYRRWTSCKNKKGRKCMQGRKFFNGWRQHELMSRLLPQVSEEFRESLQQVSKSYMEGRTSLEEYVSSLKSTVGLGMLVEAVGIGKGKEDLTRLSTEPGRNSHEFSVPNSKAWSSLEPNDIIKFLTGGFRLSKAKSNDLFWEAVWPRLLARGWHSEQPNSQGYICSKEFLVFLIPGIKKFSRRKLVKGDHYFDSVSDVLNKVVAEPNLLELEGEEAKVDSCNDEEIEKGLNEDSQSDGHRHCYLKPRASINNTNPMKFTVIGTSLLHGRKSSESRELRSIPGKPLGKIELNSAGITCNKEDKDIKKANPIKGGLDNKKYAIFTVVDTSFPCERNLSKVRELRYPLAKLEEASKIIGIKRESDGSSSDDKSSSKIEATMVVCGKKNTKNFLKGTHERDAAKPKEHGCKPDGNGNKVDKKCENPKTCLPTIKHQFCRRARSNLAAHPTKRRRLTACVKSETNRMLEKSGSFRSEKPGVSQSSCFPDANKNAGNSIGHEKNVSSVSPSAEGSANGESFRNRFLVDKVISCDKVEKCESKPQLTLDASHVRPKPEDGEIIATAEHKEQLQLQKQNDMIPEEQERPSGDVEKPQSHDSLEQQPDIIPRRQSTRNRPLTVRALESIANEFLHSKKRQKKKGAQETRKDPLSTCYRDLTGDQTMLHHQCSSPRK
ncbi:hypothetical protein S245_066566 [Arachis hypogaea]